MILLRAGFTFVFLITFSLVFSSLYVNYQPVSAQIFEFQEDDYFDIDEGNSESSASTTSANKDEDDEEDEDSSENKFSKKKKKSDTNSDSDEDSQNNDEPTYDLTESDVQKYYIQKYDLNGTYLGGFGSKGTGDGEFLHPHNIAVDSNGDIYVTDEQRKDVQKFDSKGN